MKKHELQRAADEYLAECETKQTVPHVNELARKLDLSVTKLSNYFVAVVGVRPSIYLKWRQVQHAVRLIGLMQLDYTTIAQVSGFGSRTTLFRAVRRITGKTPSYFRTKGRTGRMPRLRTSTRHRRRRTR